MRPSGVRSYVPVVLRASLLFFALLSTAAIVYTTARNLSAARLLADKALLSTAFALGSSAEAALARGGAEALEEIRGIFADRVVAYARITEPDGGILFHTNPRLTGTRVPPDEVARIWPEAAFTARRAFLGTGLPVLEFHQAIHRPDGSPVVLTLVLHTASADRILEDARRAWWPVAGVLTLLWCTGILAERIFSRQLRLREELEARRQLALIGQMTAVLAHEIRNALGSVKGHAQWVEEKLDPSDPRRDGLSFVLEGILRIEALVGDLLLYSREESYRLEALDPSEVIEEALGLSAQSWKGRIHREVESGRRVFADREKLVRVLANGVRNALEAMGEDEADLKISVRAAGRRVVIRIEDSGPGIGSEDLPRLFTPFHTTKPGGTGLGLAYSKKVVEGMGGKISLANSPHGRGAVLTIEMPGAGGMGDG